MGTRTSIPNLLSELVWLLFQYETHASEQYLSGKSRSTGPPEDRERQFVFVNNRNQVVGAFVRLRKRANKKNCLSNISRLFIVFFFSLQVSLLRSYPNQNA